MGLSGFIDELRRRGGDLVLVDGKLRYRGPQSVLSPRVCAYVEKHRTELMAIIERVPGRCEVCGVGTGGLYTFCEAHDPFA